MGTKFNNCIQGVASASLQQPLMHTLCKGNQMCELLLIVSNGDVGINLSWKALQDRANQNPHGWGVVWQENGTFALKRRPEKLPMGKKGMELVKGIRTSQFLAHVRYKVSGKVSHNNTQPFINSKNNYAFASTMSQCKVINRYRKIVKKYLKGGTGPEILFQLFLNKYKGDTSDDISISNMIEDVFVKGNLNKRASSSFVLITPSGIMAYRYRKRLYYLVRKPPHTNEVTLLSRKGYKANLSSKKNPKDMVTLLASEKLTDENWQLLTDKTLVRVTPRGIQSIA